MKRKVRYTCKYHWCMSYDQILETRCITFTVDIYHMRGIVHATRTVDTICRLIWFRIPTAYPSRIRQLNTQKVLSMNPTIWRLEGPTSSVAVNEVYSLISIHTMSTFLQVYVTTQMIPYCYSENAYGRQTHVIEKNKCRVICYFLINSLMFLWVSCVFHVSFSSDFLFVSHIY